MGQAPVAGYDLMSTTFNVGGAFVVRVDGWIYQSKTFIYVLAVKHRRGLVLMFRLPMLMQLKLVLSAYCTLFSISSLLKFFHFPEGVLGPGPALATPMLSKCSAYTGSPAYTICPTFTITSLKLCVTIYS